MFWLAPHAWPAPSHRSHHRNGVTYLSLPLLGDMIHQPPGQGLSGFLGNSPAPGLPDTCWRASLLPAPTQHLLWVSVRQNPPTPTTAKMLEPLTFSSHSGFCFKLEELLWWPLRWCCSLPVSSLRCESGCYSFLSAHPQWECSRPRATDKPREEASCMVAFTSHHWWPKALVKLIILDYLFRPHDYSPGSWLAPLPKGFWRDHFPTFLNMPKPV